MYPELINPIFQNVNQYSKLGDVVLEKFVIPKSRGKYIALCEGDDYWTDPLKLQKQVDFLESHPDYSVTFHRCKHYNVETHEMVDDNCGYLFADNNQLGVDITTAQFFKTWITQPLTMVYRVALFDLDVAFKYKYYRDMHQIYHLLQTGKGYLFAFDGGVRTMHDGGVASLITKKEYCDISIPMDGEFYRLNKSEIGPKKIFMETLVSSIEVYASINKFKAVFYCVELLMLNKSFKRFCKNIYFVIKK